VHYTDYLPLLGGVHAGLDWHDLDPTALVTASHSSIPRAAALIALADEQIAAARELADPRASAAYALSRNILLRIAQLPLATDPTPVPAASIEPAKLQAA
jgi:hypothetical protein